MTETTDAGSVPTAQTFRALASRMLEGVLVYDAAGTGLLYANLAAQALCRDCYPRDLSSGLTWNSCCHRRRCRRPAPTAAGPATCRSART